MRMFIERKLLRTPPLFLRAPHQNLKNTKTPLKKYFCSHFEKLRHNRTFKLRSVLNALTALLNASLTHFKVRLRFCFSFSSFCCIYACSSSSSSSSPLPLFFPFQFLS